MYTDRKGKFPEKALFGLNDAVGILSFLCTQMERVRGHNDELVETIYVHFSLVGWRRSDSKQNHNNAGYSGTLAMCRPDSRR